MDQSKCRITVCMVLVGGGDGSYQKTLNHLLEDGQPQPGDIPSPLAAATMRIMSVLQTNLNGKSKLYRDPALTQLFLMNNIHYMVKSIRK